MTWVTLQIKDTLAFGSNGTFDFSILQYIQDLHVHFVSLLPILPKADTRNKSKAEVKLVNYV